MTHQEEEKVYNLDLLDKKNESRNHIEVTDSGKYVPIFCRHCDEPECVATCMSGAMSKDSQTGLVSYDKEKCASCYMCIMACPYGVLKADEKTRHVVVKCDMCNGKENLGCISNCPTGAIYVKEV